jgi:hypothetical protein
LTSGLSFASGFLQLGKSGSGSGKPTDGTATGVVVPKTVGETASPTRSRTESAKDAKKKDSAAVVAPLAATAASGGGAVGGGGGTAIFGFAFDFESIARFLASVSSVLGYFLRWPGSIFRINHFHLCRRCPGAAPRFCFYRDKKVARMSFYFMFVGLILFLRVAAFRWNTGMVCNAILLSAKRFSFRLSSTWRCWKRSPNS